MPFRMAAAAAGDQQQHRTTKRARLRRRSSSSSSRSRSSSFSMLADDVLVIIYRLLADHPSSRARFRAVCRSWGAAVAAEPRVPVLPWLLLSPRDADCGGDRTRLARCPEDGVVMRISPRLGAVGRRLVGGYDGCWVVSCHPPPIRIVNLFSGAEVALSEKQRKIACPRRNHGRGDTRGPIIVSKVVFSESPTSKRCIMAAMTDNCGVALCRIGCPRGGWTIHGCQVETFIDIAFHNGDLYGLTDNGEELVRFEISENEDGAPVVVTGAGDSTSTRRRRVASLYMVSRHMSRNTCKEFAAYIVDLHGKLAVAMVTWWWRLHEPFFKIFQLDDTMCCWQEVTSLGDHALFLGQTFSKLVPTTTTNNGGDVERNRIYYCCNNSSRSLNALVHGDAVILTISKHHHDGGGHHLITYNKQDRTSVPPYDEKISSVGYFTKCGRHDIMWLLPPHI